MYTLCFFNILLRFLLLYFSIRIPEYFFPNLSVNFVPQILIAGPPHDCYCIITSNILTLIVNVFQSSLSKPNTTILPKTAGPQSFLNRGVHTTSMSTH